MSSAGIAWAAFTGAARYLAFAGLVALGLAAQGGTALARGAPDSFADLAERLSPAVVNVSTTQTLKRRNMPQGLPVPPGTPFDEFFKDFFEGEGGPQGEGGLQPRPQKVTSLGSGFVIDPSGVVITNYHVIDGADAVQVKFSNGDSLDAKILGKDELTDIAILKVQAKKPLPYVKFGNSDKARVGDWVVAIGNPFGLGGSVTAGIISAFDRDIEAGPYDDFIQTDAAINRGNSGGPLFDMEGNVVGINTAIISPTGGSIGIGFAIPANTAARVIDQLQRYGEARRGWIGVRIQTVSPEIAESLGLDKAEGALIAEVTPGGPAEKAGLKAGDLIVTFDGKEVGKMRTLPRMVAETAVGRTVPVVAIRDGQRRTFNIKVGRLDEQKLSQNESPQAPPKQANQSFSSVIGLQLARITPALRQRYQIDSDVDGVVVVGISPSSPAADQLEVGDVITEVGQAKMRTPEDLQKQVSGAKQTNKKVVLMMVNRGGAARFVGVRLAN